MFAKLCYAEGSPQGILTRLSLRSLAFYGKLLRSVFSFLCLTPFLSAVGKVHHAM